MASRVASGTDRHDRLVIQLEAILLARTGEARHPLHLAMALRCRAVLIHVDAIAPGILGGIARDVRGAHDARDAFAGAVDLHDADAHAHIHRAVVPFEAELAYRLAQVVGG